MVALTNVEERFNLKEGFTARVVTTIALTNLVLLLPLLALARRWVPPFGTATILFAFVGALSGAITDLHNLENVVALLASGVLVDVLAWWLRPSPARPLITTTSPPSADELKCTATWSLAWMCRSLAPSFRL